MDKIDKGWSDRVRSTWLVPVLSRVNTLTRDIDVANLSCLFVCPFARSSVCPWRSGIRWKRLNMLSQFFSQYGSPIILVLLASNIFTKFRQGHPLRGRYIQVGYKKFRDFLLISRYISQTIHSYSRRRIGNCTQAFEWHQFQWPWVTYKPDFKVTIIFNVK